MYQLIIHHDVGVVNKEDYLEIDKDSPGHVYLELKGDGDSVVCGVLSGVDLDLSDLKKTYNSYQEYMPHGKERLEIARRYELEHPEEKILHSKAIEITQIQYLEGVVLLDEYEQYIGKKMPSEIYGLFGNNCSHFVKNIYRSMGLEGDYTRNYREFELNQINTKLTNSYKTLFGLHAGDKPFTVFGSSIEEVAKKYNIDVSKVRKKELTQGIPDMEAALLQEASDLMSYEVLPNEQLLDYPCNSNEEQKSNLPEDKGIKINNPNQAINKQLEDLLSNSTKLQQYQEQSINEALKGLKVAEQIVPNIKTDSVQSINENYKLLQDLVGIKNAKAECEKVAKYESKQPEKTKSKPDQSEEVNNMQWLSDIMSNTNSAMHEAHNDPDMKKILKTLGNSSGFEFSDSE